MNNNALSTFDFNSNEIRVFTIDNQPWFVAADVCKALEIVNTKTSLEGLSDGQLKLIVKSNLGKTYISFPNRGATCVSKGALFSLILSSRKPEAKAFKLWVTDTVLPAIEQDGAYIMGEEKVASGEMSEDEFLTKAVIMAERKLERLRHAKKCTVQTNKVRGGAVAAWQF